MERANSKHGPRLDEEMEREVRALLQGKPGGDLVDEASDAQPEADHPGMERPGEVESEPW